MSACVQAGCREARRQPGKWTVRKGFMGAMPLDRWTAINLVVKEALDEASWIRGRKEEQMQCILGTPTATASSTKKAMIT